MVALLQAVLIGGAAGLLGGMLGIGGGIVMVPLLQSMMGREIHDAKTTSLAIIGFISIVGTIQASSHRRLDWPTILLCGVFAAVSSAWGVRLSERMSTQLLLRIFAVFLIAMGCKYLVLSFRPPNKPANKLAVEHAPALDSPHAPSSAH